MSKWKLKYCNKGLQLNYYLYGRNHPISQIKWRLNFTKPYGLHKVAK